MIDKQPKENFPSGWNPGLSGDIPEKIINGTGTRQPREWNREYNPGDLLQKDGKRIRLISKIQDEFEFEYEIVAYQKKGEKGWTEITPSQSHSRIENLVGWKQVLI